MSHPSANLFHHKRIFWKVSSNYNLTLWAKVDSMNWGIGLLTYRYAKNEAYKPFLRYVSTGLCVNFPFSEFENSFSSVIPAASTYWIIHTFGQPENRDREKTGHFWKSTLKLWGVEERSLQCTVKRDVAFVNTLCIRISTNLPRYNCELMYLKHIG